MDREAKVSIQPTKNGPYIIRGNVQITDSEGNELDVQKAVIALCRCGNSSNKPFCDGTHARMGWQESASVT
ncbi:MAG: CDGSH iron-sulfur domain-containing protein [SAR202 cluster bacterium]|nr:CDGSH iron-sulfur domain-containing protein [SAR202 cluster bacterium]